MTIAQRPSPTRIASVGKRPIRNLVWSVFKPAVLAEVYASAVPRPGRIVVNDDLQKRKNRQGRADVSAAGPAALHIARCRCGESCKLQESPAGRNVMAGA